MRKAQLAWMLLVATKFSAIGCWESGRIDLYTCDDPCGNGQPGTTCDDPCGDCRGQCVPIAPLDFDGPLMLWMGPEQQVPADCPSRAPIRAFEGHAALDTSNECPACECTEPACMFPSGLTASDQICPGDGTQTPFDAPASWGGACTSPGSVTDPLLRSVTIEPVTERPCEPVPPQVPHGGSGFGSPWGLGALACAGEIFHGECRDPGMTCVPTTEPPPPGFRQCIAWRGEGEPVCPGTYPEPFTFYSGLTDTRACTPCACTQLVASDCIALLSTYQDDGCMALLNANMMALGAVDVCSDIGMPGADLGSMDATWIANEPGACLASGGVAQGEVIPLNPKTFCCQPLL